MAIVTVTFSMDTEKYERLVRWLDGLERGRKSHAIRTALTDHIEGAITLRDVYEAVQMLRRNGFFATPEDEGAQADVPPDILENLGKLGL